MNSLKASLFAVLALGLFSLITTGCVSSGDEYPDAPKNAPFASLVSTSAQSYFQRGPKITHVNNLPVNPKKPEYRLVPGANVVRIEAGEAYYSYSPLSFSAAADHRYEIGYEGGRRYAVIYDITGGSARAVARSARREVGG